MQETFVDKYGVGPTIYATTDVTNQLATHVHNAVKKHFPTSILDKEYKKAVVAWQNKTKAITTKFGAAFKKATKVQLFYDKYRGACSYYGGTSAIHSRNEGLIRKLTVTDIAKALAKIPESKVMCRLCIESTTINMEFWCPEQRVVKVLERRMALLREHLRVNRAAEFVREAIVDTQLSNRMSDVVQVATRKMVEWLEREIKKLDKVP